MEAHRSRVRILSVTEFRQRFATSEQCEEHLRRTRWPSGFVCAHCQSSRACYLQQRKVYQCTDCRHQTSLTAGTLFHGARVALNLWFWAIYRLAQDKKGCSAMLLSKELNVSYPTAWLMGHKIRQAMNQSNQPFALQGLVELDDACLGGMRQGITGAPREGDTKLTPLLVAVEVLPNGKPGRAALRPVRCFRKPWINQFVWNCLAPQCTIRTDAMYAFGDLAMFGHTHQVLYPDPDRKKSNKRLPKVHLVISNLKRFILGRHHSIHGKHAERYLAEFNFRFNQRQGESGLFQTLIGVCLAAKPITYNQLKAAVRP